MNRKINIDYCRLFAAIMIVAIHVYPLQSFGDSIDYMVTRVMFRIFVPFFFMITGFFLLPKAIDDFSKLKRYSVKILKIYVISTLIYLPIQIYSGYFSSFTVLGFLKDLLFDGMFYHLWYFPALLFGIWVTYFCVQKKISFVFCVLFLIGLFGDSYYGLISDIPFIRSFYDLLFVFSDYTRNGLFFAPIFLYIGYWCSKKNISRKRSHIGFVLCFVFMILEGALLYWLGLPRHNSMYLLLVPVSYYLFQSLCCYSWAMNEWVRSIAMFVYILHPLFLVIVRFGSKVLPVLVQNSFVYYIVVVLLTILCSVFIEKIKNIKRVSTSKCNN